MKLLLDNRSWIIELIHSIFNHTPVIILREGQTRLTKKTFFVCLSEVSQGRNIIILASELFNKQRRSWVCVGGVPASKKGASPNHNKLEL